MEVEWIRINESGLEAELSRERRNEENEIN
jgi:hypothetical protein